MATAVVTLTLLVSCAYARELLGKCCGLPSQLGSYLGLAVEVYLRVPGVHKT